MRWTRILLFLSGVNALAFVLVYSVPSFTHRREFDQALSAWYKNPTLENASAPGIQRHKNELIHLKDSAIAALALLVVFLRNLRRLVNCEALFCR
jgi:hypothetical protein